MKASALWLEQAGVGDFLGQRVFEAVGGVLAVWALVEELEPLEFTQVRGKLRRFCPDCREHPARRHSPEDGGGLEQPPRLVCQSRNARHEHALNGLRHGEVGTKATAVRDRARDFLEEERIALGPFQNDLSQLS